MVMNKAEKAKLNRAEFLASVNRALRWSDYSDVRDLQPPQNGNKTLTYGWDSRFYLGSNLPIHCVGKACSSSIHHGSGWQKTSSQHPLALYSTRLKALQATRVKAEMEFAKWLADLDDEIAREVANPSPNYGESE
jgi:hypothetical protein